MRRVCGLGGVCLAYRLTNSEWPALVGVLACDRAGEARDATRRQFDGWKARSGWRTRAFGPPGRVPAGFWHVHRTAHMRQHLRKAAPDPRRGAPFKGQRRLPREADIGHLVTRQAQLHIRQQQEPRPAVGRLRRTQFGRDPFERLLEKAEGVFNREAGDVRLSHLGQIGRVRPGPPEPERFVRASWSDAADGPLPSGSAAHGPAAVGHGCRATHAVGGPGAVCSRRGGRHARSGHRRTTTGRSAQARSSNRHRRTSPRDAADGRSWAAPSGQRRSSDQPASEPTGRLGRQPGPDAIAQSRSPRRS